MGAAKVIALELMIGDDGRSLVRLGCQRPGTEYVLWDSYGGPSYPDPMTVASWVGELYTAALEMLERATCNI